MQDSCLCVDTSTGNYMLYVHDVPGSVLIGLPQWSSWSASRCSEVLAEGTYIYFIFGDLPSLTPGFKAASDEKGNVVRPPGGVLQPPFLLFLLCRPPASSCTSVSFAILRSPCHLVLASPPAPPDGVLRILALLLCLTSGFCPNLNRRGRLWTPVQRNTGWTKP